MVYTSHTTGVPMVYTSHTTGVPRGNPPYPRVYVRGTPLYPREAYIHLSARFFSSHRDLTGFSHLFSRVLEEKQGELEQNQGELREKQA